MLLDLLGDYYRVQGIAEQPAIEDGAAGTKYYWFEVFRRATIMPLKFTCWLVVVDVYTKEYPEESSIEGTIELDKTVTIYHLESRVLEELLEIEYSVDSLRIEVLEVKSGGRETEVVSVQFRVCGLAEPPPYEVIERAYRNIVVYLEHRDPYSNPLWVDTAYLMRLKSW